MVIRKTAQALLLFVALGSCSPKEPVSDAADAPARRVLLQNLGERVILASYRTFAERAQQLVEATQAYADAPSSETRTVAQSTFAEAMLAWERAEVYQVGPAADVSNLNPGSGGLRREIYAWNDIQPCVVDRGLASKVYEDVEGFGDAVYQYARGLSAIERLLFDDGVVTACLPSDKVLTPAIWQALVDGDLEQRRAAYAATASKLLVTRAATLVQRFEQQFLPALRDAGDGSKLFDTTQDALNALTNALFYVDYFTRDKKLGEPLGLTMSCSGDSACGTELPYSRLSRQAIVANLEALREAFVGSPPETGGTGEMQGLSDLLRSVDAGALADDLERLIGAAIAATEAIGGSLEAASRDEGAPARAAYDALQAVCDRLKTDFLLKLSLSAPVRPAGDND